MRASSRDAGRHEHSKLLTVSLAGKHSVAVSTHGITVRTRAASDADSGNASAEYIYSGCTESDCPQLIGKRKASVYYRIAAFTLGSHRVSAGSGGGNDGIAGVDRRRNWTGTVYLCAAKRYTH